MGIWEICNELRELYPELLQKNNGICICFLLSPCTTTWWLKTTKIYFFIVFKAISLKSRCGQGYALSEGSRKESGLCLSPSSQSYWQSLACRHILQPLPPSSHGSNSFSLTLLLPFMMISVILNSGFFLLVGVSYSLVILATTWFSKKVNSEVPGKTRIQNST